MNFKLRKFCNLLLSIMPCVLVPGIQLLVIVQGESNRLRGGYIKMGIPKILTLFACVAHQKWWGRVHDSFRMPMCKVMGPTTCPVSRFRLQLWIQIVGPTTVG
jgi:hypothetical protein